MSPGGRVRLAIVGGRRGGSFHTALDVLADKVELAAICDPDEAVRRQWAEHHPHVRRFERYEDLLEWDGCNAVLLATPLQLHARQSVQAMTAGKHVLSEVVAATTLDECWELVETVEKTGMTYMMAENYCYMRPNMMVLNMVSQGLFGDIIHAEGAYIHDTRDLAVRPDGSLTWRGELHRDFSRNRYPTHSLGPVAQWLGINRTDRFVSTVTLVSDPFGLRRYVRDHFGDRHPGARPGFFQQGDSAVSLLRTEKGALVVIRVDSCSPRPHNMTHYALQGVTGSYLSPRYHGEDPLIWLEGRSQGYTDGKPPKWDSLWKYADEFEHPRWKQWGEQASRAGHGGGDFFVIEDFVNAVLGGTPPPIDVYDAVTWSSLIPLSQESVAKGGSAVEVPYFAARRKKS